MQWFYQQWVQPVQVQPIVILIDKLIANSNIKSMLQNSW